MANISGPGPSLRSQWLGDKIRDLRKSRKMSLKEVGEYLQRDQGTISRYENGELPVRRGDLTVMLDLFGVSDEKLREDLEKIRKDSWQKDWWDQHREDLGKDFINLPWLESRANHIYAYQNMVIDGLLQTRATAEALIRNVEERTATEDQIARWINVRMDRQRILGGDEPTAFTVILEEYVIDRKVGGREVWREQLRFLHEVVQHPHIEVRVMPVESAPHSGHQGSFNLFEMPDPYPQVAYVDTLAGPLFVEQPTVERYSEVWKDLAKGALGPSESSQLIADRLEDNK
ncbi:helix-turn-helix domain-containing protein [Glycomyces buryatensis]|uniref:Helix-turn-helix domain-containing protein n=1 Tax=Glycomyces buryatensis TaxID=2570927 RepID=A0A4S8Q9R1_9ACTN|nr:helix-turn-helix transcriptional regulator [Glycomyces buryatensis]THV40191.1 helix-turn-helix domain-containing protein [Glycomyces buryatensis]